MSQHSISIILYIYIYDYLSNNLNYLSLISLPISTFHEVLIDLTVRVSFKRPHKSVRAFSFTGKHSSLLFDCVLFVVGWTSIQEIDERTKAPAQLRSVFQKKWVRFLADVAICVACFTKFTFCCHRDREINAKYT